MKVLITGASGLVGSALLESLGRHDFEVQSIRRGGSANQAGIAWDPDQGWVDIRAAGLVDAIVHLAGENIAGRWTPEKKARIRNSRVEGTRLISQAITELEHPPKVMVSASAIEYYGGRGSEWLDETSSAGTGFLPDVVQAWEEAAQPAREAGIRVVHLRFGMILSEAGGALAKMLPPFRLGLGGRVGGGQQYWSWISLHDVLAVIRQAITDERFEGPINVVTPNPVTNAEFTRTLGKTLRRPTPFPMPAWAARTVFGELADEVLLASTRAAPKRLRDLGFPFDFPELGPALKHLVG